MYAGCKQVKEKRGETIMYKITAEIEGMMCPMCEAHVQDAIRNGFQVKKVKASHKKGNAVIVSENPIEEEQLKNVVDQTGYTIKSVISEPYKKTLFGI